MIQNPVVRHKKAAAFPLAAANACTCCGQPLSTGQGFDVPYIGIVGPKCVKKFATLATALAAFDGQRFERDMTQEQLQAAQRAIFAMRAVGFVVTVVTLLGDLKRIQVGKMTRKHTKVCTTWRERRAEFERDLILASARQEVAAAVAA